MKNWETCEADVVKLVGPDRYWAGRGPYKIKRIVIHHNAGVLSIDDIWNVWRARRASAHYQVEVNGRIGQLVMDNNTAWHCGVEGHPEYNGESIGIEHSNSGGPDKDWPISAATLEEGAHLVAALCKLYKLGRPAWNVNVFPHQYYAPTACPGVIKSLYSNSYIARAQAWYDQMTGVVAPKPAPAPAAPSRKTYSLNDLNWVVERGDTLSSIARYYYGDAKYAKQIADYNGIPLNGTLNVGDRIWVNGPIVWVIEAPDTIRSIARYYGMDPGALAAKNGLSGPDAEIYIGNVLKVL